MLITTPPQPPPIVIVWVHGTKPNAFIPQPLRTLTDPIQNVLFLCKQGMHKASELDRQYYLYTLAKKLSEQDPEMFPWEHFYLFGWSGKLNNAERKITSEELKRALLIISREYQEKFSCTPKFQIVGHSHGCNVILYLADLITDEQIDIIIEKTILLACPVQKYTKDFSQRKIFGRVYAIHSHTDSIQIIDPQGLHGIFSDKSFSIKNIKQMFSRFLFPLFSQRHFKPHPRLIHANIRWKNKALWAKDYDPIDAVYLRKIKMVLHYLDRAKPNRGLTHVEFILIPFATQLPKVIAILDDYFDQGKQPLDQKHIDITIEL